MSIPLLGSCSDVVGFSVLNGYNSVLTADADLWLLVIGQKCKYVFFSDFTQRGRIGGRPNVVSWSLEGVPVTDLVDTLEWVLGHGYGCGWVNFKL